MIIDSHTHLDNVINDKSSNEERLKSLLVNMKTNKVEHALVLADVESLPHEKFMTNEELAKLIWPYSNLHLIGKVPLKSAKNSKYLKKIRDLIKEKIMLGIKLYPGYENFYPQDKIYNKVYDICEEFDVPVMIHSGDVMDKGFLKYARPLNVDELANNRPELKIIICHMGNPWVLDTAAVTSKNKNVYADTSGLFYKNLTPKIKKFLENKIEEFIQWNEHGEKLIFGSDWPITSIKDSISLIRDLPHFSEKEKEMIFHKNAKRLFKIK